MDSFPAGDIWRLLFQLHDMFEHYNENVSSLLAKATFFMVKIAAGVRNY